MRIKIPIFVHLLSIVISTIFLIRIISTQGSTFFSEESVKENFLTIIVLFGLVLLADLFCILTIGFPKWSIFNNAFRKYVSNTFTHGMKIDTCYKILKERNYSGVKYPYRLKCINEKSYRYGRHLPSANFYIELASGKSKQVIKFLRLTSYALQTILFLLFSFIIGAALKHLLADLLYRINSMYIIYNLLCGLGAIIPFVFVAVYSYIMFIVNFNSFTDKKIIAGEISLTYCSKCNRIVKYFSKSKYEKYEAPDFWSSSAKTEKTYKERYLGNIKSDSSEIRFYDTVVDKITITAKSRTTSYFYCPFCKNEYKLISSKDEKITI